MARLPTNLPATGDVVKLRGRDARGRLGTVDARGWAIVAWKPPKSGPAICHVNELEKDIAHAVET